MRKLPLPAKSAVVAPLIGLWAACTLVGAPAPARAQQLTCDAVLAAAQGASRARDVAAFQTVIDQINSQGSQCGVPELQCLGRAFSNAVAIRAKLDLNAGLKNETVEDNLKRLTSVRIGDNVVEVTPLYLEAIGDVHVARRNWNGASYQYQAALMRFDEGSPCLADQMAPEKKQAERRRLHKLASTAFLLAPNFQAPPESRCAGGFEGIFALKQACAGDVEEIPLPILFKYNSTEFDAEGKKAAEFLAEFLRREDKPETILSGHTDRVGSRKFNCDLAKQRLDALAAFLKGKGVQSKLVLIPMGSEEPFVVEHIVDLKPDETDRLNRRVSLRGERVRSRCGG